MRALKVLPALLALTFAVPAFAAPEGTAKPPAAAARKAGAKNRDRGAKNDARLLEALKRQGIDEARAKKVVAVVSKYRSEGKPVREEARTHRQNLRRLNESQSKDENAIKKELDALKAARVKLDNIRDRQFTELGTILKPSERAKLMEVMQRAKKHKANGAKGDKRAAKNKTQRATG